MLKEFGISSEWVLSGEEALIKIAEAHSNESDYDAVIVDWKMPVMDGLETTRQIRRIMGDAIPIIILTAYDWEEIAEAAKNMGVNTFLTKPLFRSHLYHVILQIMTGKQADKVDERTDTLVGTNTLKGHVLLVEDNELNMKIAEEFIKMNGVSMEKAWNGIEALKLFATAPADYYSLIFMDIQMPIMDGYEATRQIRQLEQDEGRERTHIVAMSANAFNEDVSKAYLAGMDDYITKPMSLQEIKKVLQSLEEKARQPEA